MMYIPMDQVVKINNRMSDIRCQMERAEGFNLPLFFSSVGELLGTLDTVLLDERNMGDNTDD